VLQDFERLLVAGAKIDADRTQWTLRKHVAVELADTLRSALLRQQVAARDAVAS